MLRKRSGVLSIEEGVSSYQRVSSHGGCVLISKGFLTRTDEHILELEADLKRKEEEVVFLRAMLASLSEKVEILEKNALGKISECEGACMWEGGAWLYVTGVRGVVAMCIKVAIPLRPAGRETEQDAERSGGR